MHNYFFFSWKEKLFSGSAKLHTSFPWDRQIKDTQSYCAKKMRNHTILSHHPDPGKNRKLIKLYDNFISCYLRPVATILYSLQLSLTDAEAAGCSNQCATIALSKVQPNSCCVRFLCFSWSQDEHDKQQEVQIDTEFALQIKVIQVCCNYIQ